MAASQDPISANSLTAWSATTPRGGRNGQWKGAVQLAARIEEDIISMGWPVGELLGFEPDLLERYGVSRSVLREAIRLLEHHGVAEMRRGRSGGLIVTEPDPAGVADSVALFLRHRAVKPGDLFEVRRSIELSAVSLAAARASEVDIARLRSLAIIPAGSTGDDIAALAREFHQTIAQISGNPAIHLFVQVVTMLTETLVDHAPAETELDGIDRAHEQIAEAIAAGDAALAQRRLLRHFDAAADAGFG